MTSGRPVNTVTNEQFDRVSAEAVRLFSERGQMVLNAVDEGIYCLDEHGNTTFVNEAATRMLAYTLREQLEAAQALDRARADLAQAFEQAPSAMATLEGPEHVVRTANPAFMRLIGKRPVIGRPFREAFPDLEGQPFFDLLDTVYRTCEPFSGERVPVKYDRYGTGQLDDAQFNVVYQPITREDARCVGILVHAVEVTG